MMNELDTTGLEYNVYVTWFLAFLLSMITLAVTVLGIGKFFLGIMAPDVSLYLATRGLGFTLLITAILIPVQILTGERLSSSYNRFAEKYGRLYRKSKVTKNVVLLYRLYQAKGGPFLSSAGLSRVIHLAVIAATLIVSSTAYIFWLIQV